MPRRIPGQSVGAVVASALVALLCGIFSGACQGSRSSTAPGSGAGESNPVSGLEVRYAVDAARPPTRFALHIPATGDAELFLGSSFWPVATDVLGHFRAPVSPETRAAIARHVWQHDLLDRSDDAIRTPEGSGAIELKAASRSATIGLVNADGAVLSLRAMLDQVIAGAVRHPVRALRLTAAVQEQGGRLRPEVTFSHVGIEPLTVLFWDGSHPAFWARVSATRTHGGRSETVALGRDEVRALVDTEKLPNGPVSVPVGAVYTASLPAFGPASGGTASTVVASATVWLPGPGASRRALELSSAAVVAGAADAGAAPRGASGNERGAHRHGGLIVKASTARREYARDEPIWIVVSLRNSGSTPLTVCGRLLANHAEAPEPYRDVSFEVIGPPGYRNTSVFRVRAGECRDTDVVLLAPGATHRRDVELTRLHSMHVAAEYRVITRYLSVTRTRGGHDLWLGTLEAPPLTVIRR